MNPKIVQKLMGHQYYSTTIDIYTHVMQKDFDDAIEQFGSLSVDEDEAV